MSKHELAKPQRQWATSAFGPVPPPTPVAFGPVSAPTLTCDGMEVVQVVQDLGHTVPLIAGKDTIVRAYLNTGGFASAFSVRGVLMASHSSTSSIWTPIPSLGAAQLNPANDGNVSAARIDIQKSLNFRLPKELTAEGSIHLVLKDLEATIQGTSFKYSTVSGASQVSVPFQTSGPLRVHAIGLRYHVDADESTKYEPSFLDFALMRSWLGRAYPVASVEWSQATIDAPWAWEFRPEQVNAYLRALRQQDVQNGVDHRTHYYAMVADGGGFLRGLASGLPQTPDPSTVACGPAGSNTWGWDNDGSYADWYGSHELGHTFGCFHAEFCGAGGGRSFPYPNGQLSNSDLKFVGLDVGDPDRQIPMQALRGDQWHDVMTYCTNQWVSDFTYNNLLKRITLENDLAAGPTPGTSAGPTPGGSGMSSKQVHVIATVNLTKKTGQIQHVTPTNSGGSRPVDPAPSHVTLRCLRADGTVIAETPAPLHLSPCHDDGEDETGIVDAVLPVSQDMTKLELLLNGHVLETYQHKAAPVQSPNNIEAFIPNVPFPAPGKVNLPERPVIRWNDPNPGVFVIGDPIPTYMVQTSIDDGKTWKTVGIGLTNPEVSLDRGMMAGAAKVLVRITTTIGFESSSSVQSFNIEDL